MAVPLFDNNDPVHRSLPRAGRGDALGNLTHVALPTGTAIDYVIDAQNRRVGKKINGTLVQGFLYQGQLTPVAELDGTGTIVSRFVYASGINVPDFMVKGDSTYRLIRDHLGSVRLVVNTQAGTVAQRIDYDEFGVETQNTNPGFQPFGYAGGLTEAATGLVRFGARDYEATSGRWTAKDPQGFAALQSNLYSYAGLDPVNAIDPSGRSWFDVTAGVLFTVAGVALLPESAIVGAAIGAIFNVGTTVLAAAAGGESLSFGKIVTAAVVGGAIGAAGAEGGPLLSGLVGAGAGAAGNIIGQLLDQIYFTAPGSAHGIDWCSVRISAAAGFVGGLVGGKIGATPAGLIASAGARQATQLSGEILGGVVAGNIDVVGQVMHVNAEVHP